MKITVIQNINIEKTYDVKSVAEAKEKAANDDPMKAEYVSDSWEIVKCLDENNEEVFDSKG